MNTLIFYWQLAMKLHQRLIRLINKNKKGSTNISGSWGFMSKILYKIKGYHCNSCVLHFNFLQKHFDYTTTAFTDLMELHLSYFWPISFYLVMHDGISYVGDSVNNIRVVVKWIGHLFDEWVVFRSMLEL